MGNKQGKRDGGASGAELGELIAKMTADPALKRLDLRSKNLDFIPQEITQLQQLSWLNLPNNNLTELPDYLGELTALQTLRLLGNRLQSLPPSIGKLVALSSLDLSKNDFVEIDDSIGLLTALTDLNLHWNIIETISPALSKLTKLKTLNASLNALSALPPLPQCALLETLDVSHNRLHDIPASCKDMPHLGSLNLAGNRIITLSGAPLAGLTSLRTLDLQGNEIKALPAELGLLTALKYLRLRSNQLTAVHADISKLSNLLELGLAQNMLTQLPVGMGQLTQLQTLHVYHNALESLPGDWGSLTALRELGVAWNALSALPKELGQLSQLAMLFANHNRLAHIPAAVFAGLGKLQELTLNNNALTALPDTLSALQELRKLDVSANALTTLPDTSQLPQLAWLELGHNALASVPASVCATTALTTLNLFANALTAVPKEIGQLVQLKKLYLGYNKLDAASLPDAEALKPLAQLEELFLSGNRFSATPKQLRVLAALTELDLSNNALSELDGDTLGALGKLKHLHLTCNRLTALPDAVGALTALVELDVAHNALKTLPEALGQCVALVDLDVSGNLLEALPRAFEQQCADLRQLKAAYNRLTRVPVMEKSKGQPADHLWISLAGNERVPLSLTDPSRRPAGASGERGSSSAATHSSKRSDEDDWSQSSRQTESAEEPAAPPVEREVQQRRVGWAEMCGRRPDMQDTLCVHLGYRGSAQRALVGLFDGHSGEKSAELVCNMLHAVVARRLAAAEQGVVLADDAEAEAKRLRDLENRPKMRRGKARDLHVDESEDSEPSATKKDKAKSEKERNAALHGEPVRRGKSSAAAANANGTGGTSSSSAGGARRSGVSKKKEAPLPGEPLPEADMVRVLTGAFRELHGAITRRRLADGTAALVMLVEHDHRRLILANSGDERAVLSRGGKAVQLTTDHKPEEPSEKVRVYDCGGFVNEQKRVDGILSLSRALGDNDLQPHVTYEPEIYTVDLAPDDAFVILACDGLWDVVSNEQAVAIAQRCASPAEAACALRDHAHMLGSTDNISVIVYRLDDDAAKDKKESKDAKDNKGKGRGDGGSKDGKDAKEGKDPKEGKEGKDSSGGTRLEKTHSKRASDSAPSEGGAPTSSSGGSSTPNKALSKKPASNKLTPEDASSPKKHARKGSAATAANGAAAPKASPRGERKD